MMNAARGTSLTGCWLKQASGQGIGQTKRQRLAQHLVEIGVDDPRLLVLAPFEVLQTVLRAIMLRELEIARGICAKSAKELDDVYLGHVEKFKGTARNTVDRIYESGQ